MTYGTHIAQITWNDAAGTKGSGDFFTGTKEQCGIWAAGVRAALGTLERERMLDLGEMAVGVVVQEPQRIKL